ncbi:MAG: hypothetical protein P1V35_11750 [Planctomycetota bacterium]|nr:hypothetical protein [Planctomycetota bacterium]
MKNATWAAIALTMAGTASTSLFAGDPVESAESTELVGRVYDLSQLRMKSADHEHDGVVLFPASRVNRRVENGSWHSLTDSFLNLVQTVLWEEVEYDGRTLDSSGDDHMYLKAPESTHADLKELLGFYERLCGAETQVQLYWVHMPKGTPSPSGLVPIDQAMQWVGAQSKDTVSMDRLSVPAYRAAVVRQVRTTPVLCEANVEIAQGVAAVDDVTRDVGSGRWAMVHAVPGIGGLHLSMTWSDVDAPNLTEADLKLSALMGAEGKPASPVRLGGMIQLIYQAAKLSSSRVYIPEGMASISKVSDSHGRTNLLIAIPGQAAPVEQSFQLAGARKDRGVAFLMRSLVPLQTRWNLEGRLASSMGWDEEWCWRNQLDNSEWMAHRALEGVAGDLIEINQVGGYMVLHTTHGVSRDQLPVAHMELDRAVKRMRDLIETRASYKVSLGVYQGDGNEVAAFQQVVSEGATVSWFCGAERSSIRDYDVEVAQYASISDPNVKVTMEGSMIELSLSRDTSGALTVQMNAQMNLPQGESPMNFSSPFFGSHKRMSYQQARFDGMQTLKASGEGGIQTAYFGGEGDNAIHLKLRVEPVQ